MAAYASVSCSKCGGKMWDNREGKRNPKAPDYKCADKACDGAVWLDSKKTAPKQNIEVTMPSHGGDSIPDWMRDQEAHEEQAIRNIRNGGDDAKLQEIFRVQDACFAHALMLCLKAQDQGIDVKIDLNAVMAQAMIAYQQVTR